jgi:YD repeat-containing protein
MKMANPAAGQPVIWTSYDHDPLGQLVSVVDDKTNTTRTTYDNLGRRTVLDSPDSGRTETGFDLAGNVTAKVTANLRAVNTRVEYDHDHNRLAAVRYPTFPANDVTYTYGGPGAVDNTAGRVVEIRDAAGTVTRGYGKQGELTRETRAFAQPARSFTTSWSYDSFNRVLQLTYPDSEVLTYDYDSGGEVTRATGLKNGAGYTYVARMDYDKFGQRLMQETGNGVRTTYTYGPADRQLATLKSKLANGTTFQDLTYTRDNVGNITKLANTAAPAGDIGGPSAQTYGYDDLYQLTSANGEYTRGGARDTYSLTLGYDSIHNTTTKAQRHEITGQPASPPQEPSQFGPIEPVEDSTNPESVQDKTSYDYTY